MPQPHSSEPVRDTEEIRRSHGQSFGEAAARIYCRVGVSSRSQTAVERMRKNLQRGRVFIDEYKLCEYLDDLFREVAAPTNCDVRRLD